MATENIITNLLQ